MPISIHAERDDHREAEDLLPWYATGQLDAADRAFIDSHLDSQSGASADSSGIGR